MDRRRVPGPEMSVAPLVATLVDGEVIMDTPSVVDVINRQGRRQDGRLPDALRPVFLKAGLITQASGSAYYEQQNTRVACGVYGPRQNKRAQFNELAKLECEFKFTTFSCSKRRQPFRDPEERELAGFLVQALTPAVRLERYPKSTLSLYISVIQSDGWWSTLAAAITCASVALVDAGIDMVDSVVATSAVALGPERLLVDATGTEEAAATTAVIKAASGGEDMEALEGPQGCLVVAQLPAFHEVTHTVQIGQMAVDELTEALSVCSEAAAKLHTVVNHFLRQSVLADCDDEA
ncbi:3'-5'-exoribonuclease [Tieghemiomyces parasiticus]|uniref:3'-5'-exoribonuclease n=1 Tax=Tieghemiomyces parasiticus TaxID=78921 RepID=A0A9W8E268_9FUNG|nr:3'-5'-exoribonuclease [Tieghemiomyces parasiticus]